MEKLSKLISRRVDSYIFKFVGAIAAGDGIIAAACLTGLPAATWKEMAQVYGAAIDRLLGAAIVAFIAFNLGGAAVDAAEFASSAKTARWRHLNGAASWICYFVGAALACWAFIATVRAGALGSTELRGAIEHCFSS